MKSMISEDDLRGMLSDFQNVTRADRETKPLVDLSVLFKFEKKYMHTYMQA